MTDQSRSILLQCARAVLLDRVIESPSIWIEDGRIARIAESVETAGKTDSTIHDLPGVTVFPGFIDIHIHGAVGVDTLDASAEDLRKVSQYLAQQGVTTWLPTLVPASTEVYRRALNSIGDLMGDQAKSGPLQARALGVHYEGPFVSAHQCGALHGEYFRTYATGRELDDLPTIKDQNAIHLTTLAPEIEGGIDLVRELTRRGWVVSIGHTRAEAAVLDRALAAGARHMTHFMNAMPPLHHRNPGPVGWGLSRDDVSCDIIADGVHLDPAMLRLLVKVKSSDRLALISDAIAAAGSGDGDYQIWGETISVVNGRTRNAQGSIAGSVISMLDAVRMMRSLGVSDLDVARMASTNPARLLGIADDCGSIEEGKRADLVGLDADGRVRFTMVGGRGLWS
jgi:N-acetylglucosamine-6-phosphate deacetylase